MVYDNTTTNHEETINFQMQDDDISISISLCTASQVHTCVINIATE